MIQTAMEVGTTNLADVLTNSVNASWLQDLF